MPPLTREPPTEQERHLRYLGYGFAALLSLVLLAVVALYLGWELPPAHMRTYYTSASGYAPPPARGVIPPGSVPRGSLTLAPLAEEVPRADSPAPRPIPTPSERDRAMGASPQQPASGAGSPAGPERGTASPQAAHSDAPPQWARLENPLRSSPEVLALGRRAYGVACAMCHGEPGGGIGPVGEHYIPRPPGLGDHVPAHSAGTLYYQITHGIRSTPTPEAAQYLPTEWHAFRTDLSPRERWAIVAYLKSAFPR